MQELVVALLVPACLLYVMWSLLPARWKTHLARWQIRRFGDGNWLSRRVFVQRAARGASGCACSSADSCPASTQATGASAAPVQPLHWHGRRAAERETPPSR